MKNLSSLKWEEEKQRREKLQEVLNHELHGTPGQEQLGALLEEYHNVLSLDKKDWGEMDLIELHTDTGDAAPRKYPVRRVPFAVREEIARKLQEMQGTNVIQPSSSPCASLMVLVQEEDRMLHFLHRLP